MFTILDYSSALEYSIMRRYTNIVYYYYNIVLLSIKSFIHDKLFVNRVLRNNIHVREPISACDKASSILLVVSLHQSDPLSDTFFCDIVVNHEIIKRACL